MKKRMAIMIILVIIIFGGIIGFYFFKQALMKKFLSHYSPPPASVTTAQAKAVDWKPYLTAIGTLKAKQSIEVTTEISGKVTHIYFKSGSYVEQGTPLVDLDSSTQQAQLKADEAQLRLAQINYQRDKALYSKRAVSRAALDSSLSSLQSAQANVEGDRATLAKTHIVAPFSGKLGLREVSIGQYIAPPPASGGNIVPLTSVDPILVQFSLPQQDLSKLQVGQKIDVSVDTFPKKTFVGTITATNAGVTEASRTILVEAQIANPKHQLISGMFVNVNVLLPLEQHVVIVPQTAIVYSLYGDAIYVVNKDKTVTQKFVTLGQTRGIDVAIEKGLQAGSEIVTSGQLKLHNGSKIEVNNKILPN